MDHLAREDEVMIKATIKLIIACAGLWRALPAVAQFEVDPDHFDGPATNVVQPGSEQSKGSMRISLRYEQVQRHRAQASIGTKSPANTLPTLSGAEAVQHPRVSGVGRVARGPADRKGSEQSRVAPSHRVLEWMPQ